MELKGSATEQNLKDAFAGTLRRSAIPLPGCQWATPRRISRRRLLVRLTSTPTCTLAWPRRRVTRGLTKSQTGSRRLLRLSAATQTASRKRWTTSTVNPSSRLSTMRGATLLPSFFRAYAHLRFTPIGTPLGGNADSGNYSATKSTTGHERRQY